MWLKKSVRVQRRWILKKLLRTESLDYHWLPYWPFSNRTRRSKSHHVSLKPKFSIKKLNPAFGAWRNDIWSEILSKSLVFLWESRASLEIISLNWLVIESSDSARRLSHGFSKNPFWRFGFSSSFLLLEYKPKRTGISAVSYFRFFALTAGQTFFLSLT